MKDIFQSYNKSCYACGTHRTYRRRSDASPNWYKNKPHSQYLCQDCYMKYIRNPLRNKTCLRKSRILFKDKRVNLTFNPRTGICSKCKKEGRTDMHHEAYYIIFKWFATIELCVSCHTKKGWLLGELG